MPVDVQIQDEYDLRDMVELSRVIQDTGQAKKFALVVVDACRDDPLATKILAQSLGSSRSTSLGQGLAAPKLPTSQSLIAYATAADFVAYDGGGVPQQPVHRGAVEEHPDAEARCSTAVR